MSKTSELARLRQELADVRESRKAVFRLGQQYKLAGSHDTTMPELSALAREERRIKGEILRLISPGPTRTIASFGGAQCRRA